jgi:hypothetical protein
MQLYDMNGNCCGNCDGHAPDGYWLRSDDAPVSMASLDFLDKIGATNFGAIWQVMEQSPSLAFTVMRGFAAQSVTMADSFPQLMQMEKAGLIPAGTAIKVWS